MSFRRCKNAELSTYKKAPRTLGTGSCFYSREGLYLNIMLPHRISMYPMIKTVFSRLCMILI